MQILNEKIKRTSIRFVNELPNEIIVRPGMPAVLQFETHNMCGSCLKCDTPSCIYLDSDVIKCEKVKEFPEDRDNRVCPVGAISWNEKLEAPVIDDSKCIHCGLCARQCPVGAIYYGEDRINICYDADGYEEEPYSSSTICQQKKFINEIRNKKRTGCFTPKNDHVLEELYRRIQSSCLLPEKFVRNIMVGLGCKCATRRVGDVYVRMDAIYNTPNGTFGAIEVEFGADTLSAARGILDDIAVLHSRYQIDKHHNTALVVCLSLPNLRQGYWQVVKDIAVVENIKINTLTCGAMLVLLWNQMELDLGTTDFYVDYDTPSIRALLNDKLGRDVQINEKVLGVIEPIK